MNSSSFRLPEGGRIDRSKPIDFTFDGQNYIGFAGDTLASALIANGVNLVGRSFKLHRPRGILSAGPEEPNGLVQTGDGDGVAQFVDKPTRPLAEFKQCIREKIHVRSLSLAELACPDHRGKPKHYCTCKNSLSQEFGMSALQSPSR